MYTRERELDNILPLSSSTSNCRNYWPLALCNVYFTNAGLFNDKPQSSWTKWWCTCIFFFFFFVHLHYKSIKKKTLKRVKVKRCVGFHSDLNSIRIIPLYLADVTRGGKWLLRPGCNVTLDHQRADKHLPVSAVHGGQPHHRGTQSMRHASNAALIFCCPRVLLLMSSSPAPRAFPPPPSAPPPPPPPPLLLTPQHTCHYITQQSDWRCGAVYISAGLALSSWPCIWSRRARKVRSRAAGELRWTEFQPVR